MCDCERKTSLEEEDVRRIAREAVDQAMADFALRVTYSGNSGLRGLRVNGVPVHEH